MMMGSANFSELMQPLVERAGASKGATVFTDVAAIFVLEKLGFGHCAPKPPNVLSGIKQAQWIDAMVLSFLESHPCAHGIELAGGLSTRFHRLSAQLDWPRFSWQALNSHDVTDCLDYVFPETDNLRHVASDNPLRYWPTFLGWGKGNPVVVIVGENEPVAGSQVRELIKNSCESFHKQGIRFARLLIRHTSESLKPTVVQYEPRVVVLDERNLSKPLAWYRRLAQIIFLRGNQTQPVTISCVEFNCDQKNPKMRSAMYSKYFCPNHAKRMQTNEVDAYRRWLQMMHLGVKAYVECRVDTALIYLNAALEIALLRTSSEAGEIFSESQIIKPVEFLIELLVVQEQFDRGNQLLMRVLDLTEGKLRSTEGFQELLAGLFSRVETAEKDFFSTSESSDVFDMTSSCVISRFD